MYPILVLIPLVVGIGAIIEKAGVKAKYIPLVNLINGIFLGVLTEQEDMREGIIIGLYLGLTASGLSKCSTDIFKEYHGRKK